MVFVNFVCLFVFFLKGASACRSVETSGTEFSTGEVQPAPKRPHQCYLPTGRGSHTNYPPDAKTYKGTLCIIKK